MKRFLLKNCLTDEKLISAFIKDNKRFGDKSKADYLLDVVDTHVLYKYEEEDRVVYVHYDNTNGKLFRVCIYEANNTDPANLEMPKNYMR